MLEVCFEAERSAEQPKRGESSLFVWVRSRPALPTRTLRSLPLLTANSMNLER